jgi:uncharacterized protein (DUF924 family)
MSDPEIQRVLDFWFSDSELDAPTIDSRMERWFGTDPELDEQIEQAFGQLVQRASNRELMHWKDEPTGRLALIILLDQFRRNIYRGSAEAFALDTLALKLCIEGTMNHAYQALTPFQQLFFFMPLQHTESLKVQEKSVRIYAALAERVSETLHETFMTTVQFAELHRDIVAEFGRFPHRNKSLGRTNTRAEDDYLKLDAPEFGQ